MQQANSTAALPRRMAPTIPALGATIDFGEGPYNQIMGFLIREARLLDDGLLDDWLALVSEDIFYHMPVRQTVARKEGSGFHGEANWFYENLASLSFKVKRIMKTESAFAEDPPSRARRFVTNMILHETAAANEYLAQSYLLLLRNQGDAVETDVLSARRDDIIRRTPDGWKLSQRTILMDTAALGMSNLAIFL